jgi:hypothetical protein
MKRIHQNPADAQRPCHAILRRRSPKHYDWQSDFVGELFNEDGRHYQIGVTVRSGRDGQQEPDLYLRPTNLYKTPVTPGRLEVVR